MPQRKAIADSLSLIFRGIEGLRESFEDRQFTIDGRLVGDIGEVIAALEYGLVLDDVSQPDHDATTFDGRRVQIKATFKDSLTFKTVPDYYLGLKLSSNGTYEEIYNGPGSKIYERYSHRKGIGSVLLSFPNEELKKLSAEIEEVEKVPNRNG